MDAQVQLRTCCYGVRLKIRASNDIEEAPRRAFTDAGTSGARSGMDLHA